jgi:hypothetical protein
MTERIILDIHHSDDYTDYLLMTAGLTNKRIIPMLDPSTQQIKAKSDNHTRVLRCYNTREGLTDQPVESDANYGSIRIRSRFYLADDGTVNATHAEMVRQAVQDMATNCLMAPNNIREVFRHYFPFLWSRRQAIYQNPKLFFASSGRYGGTIGDEYMPIGAVLKAIEEDPRNFRIRLGGGCNCSEATFLLDWDHVYGEHWTLYTWCPVCHSRREIKTWNFQRAWNCEQSIDDSAKYYDKGQGLSALSLFDVIDAIKEN